MTQDGKLERWRQREVTVQVDQNVTALGPDGTTRIERAFAAWADSGTPNVTVERGAPLSASMEPDGVNAVLVAPITVSGHEHDLAVTIAFFDSTSGEIVEADIVINSSYRIEPLPATEALASHVEADDSSRDREHQALDLPATDGDSSAEPSCNGNPARGRACDDRYDLESIVAHEAGHFFGLGEDEDDGLTTMYYCTSPCETHKRSPERADLETMREVYADGFADPGEVTCSASGATRSKDRGAALVLTFLGLLVPSRRARATKRPRRR
jgi:hypothetical protein